MSRKQYELDSAIKEIEQLLKSTELIPKLYQSVESISRILCAIIKTGGENWLNEFNEGQLNSIERAKLNNVFKPYIPFILSFFNGKMKGGVNEDKEKEAEELEEVKDVTDTADESDESANYGPDDLTEKIMNTFGFIDSTVNQVALSDFGILKMEKDSDSEPDIRLFPDFITKPIYGLNPAISKGLEQIRVPFRTLVIVVYLLLDIARMASATVGNDMNRNILSVVVAVLDLLRGDWKKAIMTIMGYFGTTPLFMGQLGKVYLTLFQTLSPNIQNNFIFGTIDSVKSLIVGILLAVFKVAAPYELRRPIIEVLDTIAKHKQDIDGVLEESDLKPLPDYMAPTFNDLNNLQSLMDDPAFICSSEHQELVKTIDNSAIIHIVLQLLRIPVTERFRQYHCGTETKSFVERIVERQSKPVKIPQKGSTGDNEVKNGVENEVKGATGMNEVKNEVKGATGMNGENKVENEVKGATGYNKVENKVKNEVKGATGTNEVENGVENKVENKVENEVKGATGYNKVENKVENEVKVVNPEAGVTGTMQPMMYPPMYPPMYPQMYPPMYPQMYPPGLMQQMQQQPMQQQPMQPMQQQPMQPIQPQAQVEPLKEQKGGNTRKLRRSYST
jgi:hypothetical protein